MSLLLLFQNASPRSASASQTLADLQQSASAVAIAAATASQTLGTLTAVATAIAPAAIFGSQTLDALTQISSGSAPAAVSGNQAFDSLSQVATAVAVPISNISGDQVLDSLTQVAQALNAAPKSIPIGFGFVHTYSRKHRKKLKKVEKEEKRRISRETSVKSYLIEISTDSEIGYGGADAPLPPILARAIESISRRTIPEIEMQVRKFSKASEIKQKFRKEELLREALLMELMLAEGEEEEEEELIHILMTLESGLS